MARALKLTDVLGPRGLLATARPGWEPRPSQLEMAAHVEGALRSRRPLLVEAGTGTGKTLAYLVPALLSGLKVVVSTGTKNLQQQILEKDIPLLQAMLPFPFRATVLKGISNYLCRRRFKEHQGQQLALGGLDSQLATLRAWADATETGDRAELDLPDASPLWREVSSTSETRLGARCPHFEDCFVTRARREAQQADLLVVNHHLFFADLALKAAWPQAQLLPAYEAVIFDEAHGIEDVATDYFSITVSTLRLGGVVRDVRRAIAQTHLDARLEATCDHVEHAGDALFGQLRERLPRDGRALLQSSTWAGDTMRGYYDLDNALDELEGAVGSTAPDTPEGLEEVGSLGRRLRSLRDDLTFIAEAGERQARVVASDDADDQSGWQGGWDDAAMQRRAARAARVYWGETRGRTVLLHASPVDVADLVRERVVAPVEAVVFTSATLSTGGNFEHVRARLGLDAATEARLPSPFDYARQALLYLPKDLPEPQAPQFTDAVAERMVELCAASRGRAFLLFTSHRQLLQVSQRIAHRLEVPVLVQGERPKHHLLDEFRKRPSVLMATASFWEGVDVVGEALQLVVIDKLPFAPPGDPLVEARCRRLEDEGRDPFAEYQVPEAALALAQGFGRLIRHRGDRGVVALLDRRATTRRYGEQVLSALPKECPRTTDLATVKRFFEELRALGRQGERESA